MDLRIHASGSAGNLYSLVGHNCPPLMIECGLPIKKIRKKVGDLNKFRKTGCLISHEHNDHARAARDLQEAGIPIYCNLEAGASVVGGWTVRSFQAVHDVPCNMFVVSQADEHLLFATDTCEIPYNFKGLTQVAIECNYDVNLVYDMVKLSRLRQTHMSIADVVSFLDKTDLSKVEKIYLLHLSDDNSDEEGFIRRIQNRYGIPVYTK